MPTHSSGCQDMSRRSVGYFPVLHRREILGTESSSEQTTAPKWEQPSKLLTDGLQAEKNLRPEPFFSPGVRLRPSSEMDYTGAKTVVKKSSSTQVRNYA
jgi:hypothetical protein